MSDFPIFRPNVSVGDADDFLSFHPTPRPPVAERPADPVGDAFGDARRYAAETPFGGKGSMLLVDRTVCKFPCNIADHQHNQPHFEPDPELDQSHVGWTVQHIPLDPDRGRAPKRCVLCWEMHEDLHDHDCQVMAVANA